jgi:hypothetical protein
MQVGAIRGRQCNEAQFGESGAPTYFGAAEKQLSKAWFEVKVAQQSLDVNAK